MKIYKLYLDILTPVHIGDGSEIEAYEYIIGDRFYKVDLTKFIMTLSQSEQETFNNLLGTNIIKCRAFMHEYFKDMKAVIYSTKVSEHTKTFYTGKITDPRNQLLVYPFIRTKVLHPYMPGSSIKGALRTGIIFNLFNNKNKIVGKHGEKLEALLLKCEKGFVNKNYGSFIPKGLDPQKDPFRCIKISDIMLPAASTTMERITTTSHSKGVMKSLDISITKETTFSEHEGNPLSLSTEVRYDDSLFRINRNIERKITMEEIIESHKRFSQQIIESEKKFFKGHFTFEVYKKLEDCWSTLDSNEFLFRVGWGSGYNSMTVNLKKPNPDFIKTRKLINEQMPLGWIKGRIELIS